MNKKEYEELKIDFIEVSDKLDKKTLILKNKLYDIDWAELTPNNVIFVIVMIALVLFRFLISSFLLYAICTLLIYAVNLGKLDYQDVEKIFPIDNYVTWALLIYGGYYLPIYYKELAFKRKLRKIKKN
ncbi:hypothetical protein FIT82_05050 [Candidatus Methylopumilus universalis]|uniref:hypothetical protein n=1 Tax=Candidatus Methylopumilus universalis TaxID=2588536 RepID=UPI0011238C3D|nr:hypothetical protein [Candidatus Methylopumilus universalis]QDC81819.1 hypothetical protein FIT82_05050 [Candidatus Methylopumilus universalis]